MQGQPSRNIEVSWNLGVFMYIQFYPRDPITLSEDDWGLQSPPQQGIFGSITILRRWLDP